MVAQIRRDLFPLARNSAKGTMKDTPEKTKNPVRGLMDLDQRLVRAMIETGGLYWGACEFGGGQSGDLMHFDMGMVPPDLAPTRGGGAP